MRKEREREEIEFMVNRMGYSPAEANIEYKLRKRNTFIRNAMIASAAACTVAYTIAAGPRYAHILQDMGLDAWADIVKNSDALQFMGNHVKGAFQTAFAGQIANGVLSEHFANKARKKVFAETGLHRAQPMKDFSLLAGASLFTLNLMWEISNIFVNHQAGLDVYDTVLPTAALGLMVVFNKAVHHVANKRYETPKVVKSASARAPTPARPASSPSVF